MSAPGATEFNVPDPLDDRVIWRVRFYHNDGGRSYWMRMKLNSAGQFIPVNGFVPAAPDPMIPEPDPDDYGGLA